MPIIHSMNVSKLSRPQRWQVSHSGILPSAFGISVRPRTSEQRCLHNKHGYFVGIIKFGSIRRLSVKYYNAQRECLEAIANGSWARRRIWH